MLINSYRVEKSLLSKLHLFWKALTCRGHFISLATIISHQHPLFHHNYDNTSSNFSNLQPLEHHTIMSNMDRAKLPHLRVFNNQQPQSTVVDGKIKKATCAEPSSSSPSNGHGFVSNNTNGLAWSGNRSGNRSGNQSDNLTSNVRGTPVLKSTPTAWNLYAGKTSSSTASSVRQKSAPQTSWNDGQASSSNASIVRQQPAPETSNQAMLPPHLRVKSAATPQASKPTLPMNAGKQVKSAKVDSKVPCTYEDCTRGFTKESDMKRHKDEDHEWCRMCNVDCADYESLLEHKVQSDLHICCDFCGEDFRSDMGKERHMRQVI